MSDRPTPETDAAWKEGNAIREWTCRKMERERDEANELLASEKITRNHIIKRSVEVERERDEAREIIADSLKALPVGYIPTHTPESIPDRIRELLKNWVMAERERDEAREHIERQKLEIVRLNGATNHAGGTPLKIALRKRDEAREALREIWQSGDAFLPHVDQATINRWRRAAGQEEVK